MSFGDVPVSEVVGGPVEVRLQNLVEALWDRKVVPLVGAGVSAGRIPVAEELVSKLAPLVADTGWRRSTGDDSFARVAEIAIRNHDHATVCVALGIANWAKVPPTPAHRYLAMLAADGFIDEVISTNYDCGIENAWEALGRGGGLQVITDATELHTRRDRWRVSELRLYKINGCSGKLARFKAEPNTILLTDSQLQGFQNRAERRWVRDLLRTTTRCRTLVLSGFGSDEPQVWHVVRLILEELRALRHPGGDRSGEAPRLWVALYEHTIPFHLLTALADEAKLRNEEPLKKDSRRRFENVFSKADSPKFGLGKEAELDAGAFWRRVWIEVFHRSLSDAEGPPARTFTRAMTGRTPRRHRTEDMRFFGLWSQLVHEVVHRLPLDEPVSWHAADDQLPGSPGITWAHDRYVTVSEEPEYWVVTLLLLLLHDEIGQLEGVITTDGEPVLLARLSSLALGGIGSRVEPARPQGTSKDDDRPVAKHITADLLHTLHHHVPASLADIEQRVRRHLLYTLADARRQEAPSRGEHKRKADP